MEGERYALSLPFCIFNFALLIFLAGCDQQQQAVLEKHAEEAVDVVQNAAGKTATEALEKTSKTATKTLEQSAKDLAQGGVALRVKSALALSSRLDGATIDVDLQGNTIILRGEVLTPKQKAIARSLAENILDPKFQVVNRLKVAGRFSQRRPSRSARGY